MNRSKHNKSPSPSKGTKHGPKHWSQRIHETIVFAGTEGLLNLVIQGGAENGQFCYIGEVRQDKINYHSGKLHHDEIILEIQGEKVAGYTLRDLLDWLQTVSKNGQPVLFKTIKSGTMTRDLREYLNTRFEKNSLDHELQQKIRDNVYKRTVPCTTRVQRPGELDNVDYKFLTVDEFLALEKSGNLLESGLYDGNHYGTPKPSKDPADNPFRRTNSMGTLLPGQHPSSEGKRRRNRSNIEITSSRSSLSRSPTDNGPVPLSRKKSLERAQSTTSLGPLPPNWEMSFTEDNVPYFIDHNTETTHWLDPRLTTSQKIDPLLCREGELPYGWEKVEDSVYGAYYIDHVNRKTQYENPVLQAKRLAKDGTGAANENSSHGNINGRSSPPSYESHRPAFTKNPAELKGKFLRTELLKSPRGFGFTIIGGEDSDTEFLQIKNVVPNGPADHDGKLQRGDVLVYINTHCVLGYTHQDVVSIFQTIPVSGKVALEVCRGYPLPFDPDDPNTEIVTTMAVTLPNDAVPMNPNFLYSNNNNTSTRLGIDNLSANRRSNKSLPDLSRTRENSGMAMRNRSFEEIHNQDSTDSGPGSSPSSKPQIYSINIVKGNMGFGFTIADSVYGQKVKQILDRPRCKNLQEGDILVEINRNKVKDMAHSDVVQVLKNCPKGTESAVVIQRGGILTPSRTRKHGADQSSPVKTSTPEIQPQNSEPTYSNVPRHPFYSPDQKREEADGKVESASESKNADGAREPSAEQNRKPSSPKNNSRRNLFTDQNKNESGDPKLPSSQTPDSTGPSKEQAHRSPPTRRSKTPVMDSQSQLRPQELRSKTPTAEMMSQMSRASDSRYGNHPPYNDNTHNQNVGSQAHDSLHSEYGPPRPSHNPSYEPQPGSSAHGYSPPHREHSFNDLDHRGGGSYGTEGRFRSRTPGPEFMRSRDQEENLRPTPELRSKTPTNEYNQSRHTSNISGTPNFIPASVYQNPPPGQAGPRSGQHPPGSSRPTDNTRANNQHPTGHQSRFNSSSSYSNSPNLSVPGRTYKSQSDGSGKPTDHNHVRKQSTSFENEEPSTSNTSKLQKWSESPGSSLDRSRSPANLEERNMEMTVTLMRQESGFGFRIIGGTEEGSQVSVGYIVPSGSAEVDGRLRPGDEILLVDNQSVLGASHHKVVQMMGHSSNVGHVTLALRRRPGPPPDVSRSQQDGYPYDVTVTRRENEGFGFVIISSVTRAGSVIGKIIEGSPAERCGGLHIGDRILTVNNSDITQMHHEEIVSLIKVSGYSVTLTIGQPQVSDDASSMTSNSQRAGSTTSSVMAPLNYPAQSESDLSRRSEYSPYHNTQPQVPVAQPSQNNRAPPHQPVLDKQKELRVQRNMVSQPSPEQDDDKYYAIELHKGSRGFGFSIRGGKEFDNMPLYVLKIADNGAADLDNRIRVGDQIIEINGYNTNNMTHADAIELISSGGAVVKLLIKRSTKTQIGSGVNTGPAVRSPSSNPSPLPSMPNGPVRSQGQGSPSGMNNRMDNRNPYLYSGGGSHYGNSQMGRPNLGY